MLRNLLRTTTTAVLGAAMGLALAPCTRSVDAPRLSIPPSPVRPEKTAVVPRPGPRNEPGARASGPALDPSAPDAPEQLGAVRFDVAVVHGETGAALDVPVAVTVTRASREAVLSVQPPDGLVAAATSTLRLRSTLREDTHTVSATFVLVPAVRVVIDPDPRFRGRVLRSRLWLGDKRYAPIGRSPLLYRVPRHPGAYMRARIETRESEGRTTVALPADATRLVLPIPLPVPDPARTGVWCTGAPGARSIAPRGDSSLRVLVFDRDGDPAQRAAVRLEAITPDDRLVLAEGRTDAHGTLVLENLAAASGTVTTIPSEGLPSIADVTLAPGIDRELRIDEPVPSTVQVIAVDRRGRPVTAAAVSPRFDGGHIRLSADGVQQLTHVTGATGACLLRGAPPRGLELHVSWGGCTVAAVETSPGRFEAVLPVPANE